jgi:hypothetical protein
VSCHSGTIDGGAFAWEANALGDVKDDACEAVFVEVNLLMVWDLANRAVLTIN